MGKQWKQWETFLSWAPKSLQMVTAAMKLKALAPWKKSYDQPRHTLKSRDIMLPAKVHLVKAKVFPVVMYGCESWTIKKGCVLKNWCFWTVVLEKTLESPLDSKEIKPVHPKGNQSWIFTGRTENPTLFSSENVSILWQEYFFDTIEKEISKYSEHSML